MWRADIDNYIAVSMTAKICLALAHHTCGGYYFIQERRQARAKAACFDERRNDGGPACGRPVRRGAS